jgi:Flp pilus assembly protein TadD
MQSDPARAAQHFQSAAATDAEFEPATTTLLAALKASSREPVPARAMLILGRALGLVEQWGLAAREFSRATEIRPQEAEAWAWLGEAKQHVGQDGLPDLDRALAADPRDGTVHILRGLYFRRHEKNSEAIGEYARAAELEPQNPAVQSSLGEAYAASGDLVAALAAYQTATSIAPAEADYWRLLALFCADNDVQVTEIGLPAAQKAAQIEPKDPAVLDALGWSYAQAGYFDQAEKALKQAIDAPTASPSPHVHLAVLYLRLGENAQALGQLNAALQIDSTGAAAESARRLLAKYFPSANVPTPVPAP